MTAIVTVCVPVYGQDLVLQLTLLSDCFLALESPQESFLPLGALWRLLSEGREGEVWLWVWERRLSQGQWETGCPKSIYSCLGIL